MQPGFNYASTVLQSRCDSLHFLLLLAIKVDLNPLIFPFAITMNETKESLLDEATSYLLSSNISQLELANYTVTHSFLFPGLNFEQSVLVLSGCLFLTFLLIIALIICIRRLCKNRRTPSPKAASVASVQPANNSSKSPSKNSRTSAAGNYRLLKTRFLSHMIARIDEFDSLTPLVMTPGSLSDECQFYQVHYYKNEQSAHHGQFQEFLSADDNQPLIEITTPSPMRADRDLPNPNGPVAIVNRYLKYPFEELDLVSIDRNSPSSTLEKRSGGNGNGNSNFYKTANFSSGSDLQFHCSLSDYLPSDDTTDTNDRGNNNHKNPLNKPPCSTAQCNNGQKSSIPFIHVVDSSKNSPKILRRSLHSSNGSGSPVYQQLIKSTDSIIKRPASKDSLASDLSSPVESSANDSDSPLDTTGSIADLSDSNYNASESDTSEAIRQPSSWATTSASRTSGLIGAAKSLLPGNNGGNFNSGLELSPVMELTTLSYSAAPPLPRRYPLHSIKEESDEHDHNVSLPKIPPAQKSSTRPQQQQFPQTRTDESLSRLSQEGGGSVDSVELGESSRGRSQQPPQSTSGHLLAAMFKQGKIKTGGFPSWFPKREGLI